VTLSDERRTGVVWVRGEAIAILAGALVSAVAIVAGFPSILGLPVAAFVLIGPGLAAVRLLGLGDRLLELVLGVGLSIGMTGLLLLTQLYAGLWWPAATLAILVGVATGAVIADPLVVPRSAWTWLGAGSRSLGRGVGVGLATGGRLVASAIGAMSAAFVMVSRYLGPRAQSARLATRSTGASLASRVRARAQSARLATRSTSASVTARVRALTAARERAVAAAAPSPPIGSKGRKPVATATTSRNARVSGAPPAERRLSTPPSPVQADDPVRGPSFATRVRAALAGFREPDLVSARHEPVTVGSAVSAERAKPSPRGGAARTPPKAMSSPRGSTAQPPVPIPMRPTRITVAAAARAASSASEGDRSTSRFTRPRSVGSSIVRRAEDASKRLTGARDVAPAATAEPRTPSRRRPKPAAATPGAPAATAEPRTPSRRPKPAAATPGAPAATAEPRTPSRRRPKPAASSRPAARTEPEAATPVARSPRPKATSQPADSSKTAGTRKPPRQPGSSTDRQASKHRAPVPKRVAGDPGSRLGSAKSTHGNAPAPAVDSPKGRPGARPGRTTQGAEPLDSLALPKARRSR